MQRWLDLVRAEANIQAYALVQTKNDFPTASGLASSASAYAALAVAATKAAGLTLSPSRLSVLARRGSGSAARSIFGGLVQMHAGAREDGTDAYAQPIPLPADWPLRIVVAIVGGGQPKKTGSRDAMSHCQKTSPLHAAWVDTVDQDLSTAMTAIANRDLDALGTTTEASALAMHASILAARPAILYWQPATLHCLEQIRTLRDTNIPAYATIDAGPHVKALTDRDNAPRVATALTTVAGVTEVKICHSRH